MTTRLTDKSTINVWLVVPGDKDDVDWQSGSDDSESNETLDGVVEQRKHNKERHDHEEEDRQQQVHLRQHSNSLVLSTAFYPSQPGFSTTTRVRQYRWDSPNETAQVRQPM